jgi:hypothetical protein
VREIQIVISCDACFEETQARVSAGAVPPLGFDGQAAAGLDLCEKHRAELIDPLLELLQRFAIEAEPTGPEDGRGPRWTCPRCGRTLAQASALSHVWQVHRPGQARTQPPECPDCKFGSPRSQTMGLHRVREHGWDPIAAALEGVSG